ncbi:methyltransferase domain-containing protein [Actinacidiphila sp. ITFR-21]|uniref:methyltransferase domain-containing protein n=1 Tax=Actinacidiphila sp. ITFR-21 TaxID=3075199 RepID=UPI00288BCB50|nr:methyltransferase domain-containing protein [Streptomyces sp. ITFR-21]WNI17308.1 methyltransferase domain-containing protein [Streptomyces sp. ITFR-21]
MTLTGHQVRTAWADLVCSLVESGTMTPQWATAFREVDRARFLPAVVWPYDMATRTSTRSDRNADPDGWYGHADANVPVTTQWDDGRHEGPGPGRVPTSSASAPSVVAAMLRDLDVRDGLRVLEIGTGTGWNAGLLTRRLGDGQVTSVEVDPAVAATAATALHETGLSPELVVADGLPGHPAGAPYDRVIATMAVRAVPYAWVRQTVPTGVVVTPWGTHYSPADAVARLVVAGDHSRAEGRFTRPVEFMKARTHRLARTAHAQYVPGGDVAAAAESVTGTDLAATDLGHPFGFVAGLFVGHDCVSATDRRGADLSFWLYGITDRSWAAAVLHDGRRTSTVYQGGPRRLWDGIETAHTWWAGTGRPDITRFGLTVTPDGQTTWLDTPHRPLPVPQAAADGD